VLQELVADRLQGVGCARAKGGHAVDDIGDEVKPVEVVQHNPVEWGGRRAFFRVTAHMQVVIVRAPIRQAMDEQRITMKGKDDRLVGREEQSMKGIVNLEGKKGLVMGVANADSIAYGCAKVFHECGAEQQITYGDAKAEPYVREAVESIGNPPIMLCDVREDAQLAAVFETVLQRWGCLDFVVHCVAFAPKEDLHGRVVDCSREGFLNAMDVSCYSFIRLAKLAEPLMDRGGCLLTMSYYGAEKVIDHYNVMGPVKAALEASVRYLAAELGSKNIRVHAVSPGPLKTRAASGIRHFDELIERAAARAPMHHRVTIDDVGAAAASLICDAAAAMTGHVVYVDGGYHIMG